jgi:hypothetical protein
MGVRERWRSASMGAVVIRSNRMARAWRPGGRTVSASSSMLCVAHLGAKPSTRNHSARSEKVAGEYDKYTTVLLPSSSVPILLTARSHHRSRPLHQAQRHRNHCTGLADCMASLSVHNVKTVWTALGVPESTSSLCSCWLARKNTTSPGRT